MKGDRMNHYPEAINLMIEHDPSAPFANLVMKYVPAGESVGGKLSVFAVTGKDEDLKAGSPKDLHAAIVKLGDKAHYVQFKTADETTFQLFRDTNRNSLTMQASYPSETSPSPQWMHAMAGVAKSAAQFPGFRRAALARLSSSSLAFVPLPPIARNNHLVMTYEGEVAEAYDDLPFFWKVWDHVEAIGDLRLCTRGLEDVDDVSWLARTFEDTMQLVRVAKPGKTLYSKPYWDDDFRPWWEYGDIQNEKAGYPALAPVGYDEATKSVELTGFITKMPLREGGPEPRHVLIREIYDVRSLAKGKKDSRGRPVETVKITWPEEWMAMSERRPLLDNGARVFYMDRKANKVVEVTS
jgi:hypothetical protein